MWKVPGPMKKFYQEAKANKYKLDRAMRIVRLWIPVIVVLFTAVYWLIGLYHAGAF